MNREHLISILIVVSLILGAVVGQALYDPSWQTTRSIGEHRYGIWLELFEFLGFTVFIGLLKMMIIPLIAASVVSAVTSVGDIRTLGRLGGWTLVYYFCTMLIAVLIGLTVVLVIEPGQGLVENHSQAIPDPAHLENAAGGVAGAFRNLVASMIPENIFAAMAAGQTLPVIVFFIFFGVVLTMIGEPGRSLAQLAEAIFSAMMKMIELVLWLAPLGVFCLLAWTVGRIGLGVFGGSIGAYILTVAIGLAIHGVVVLPLILWLFTKENPFVYAHRMRNAIMMAIGTSSSSATLPVTIEAATEQGGVSKKSAGLVLPLGATINMDGTALYEAVAVVFLAQASGIQLGLTQLFIIAITATLAAVGAAGIPSAGLVTMIIVVEAVNHSLLSLNPSASLIPLASIGLIIGVDRLLDMFRTGVNVWGDAVGAKILTTLD